MLIIWIYAGPFAAAGQDSHPNVLRENVKWEDNRSLAVKAYCSELTAQSNHCNKTHWSEKLQFGED